MKRLIKSIVVSVAIAVAQCMPLRADIKKELPLDTMLSSAAYIIGGIYLAQHLFPTTDVAPKNIEQPFDIRNLISPEAKKAADDWGTAVLKGAVAIFCTKK